MEYYFFFKKNLNAKFKKNKKIIIFKVLSCRNLIEYAFKDKLDSIIQF